MPTTMEAVVVNNDLAKMSSADRWTYYCNLCKSLNLNPLTRPFQLLNLSGKLSMYATKDCTEQLRKLHGVSLEVVSREEDGGVILVTCKATDASGRTDESIGAVACEGLRGEAKANAFMKAETKAKRRVTLSICGLGVIDESEVSSIPGATLAEFEPVDAHLVNDPSEGPERVSEANNAKQKADDLHAEQYLAAKKAMKDLLGYTPEGETALKQTVKTSGCDSMLKLQKAVIAAIEQEPADFGAFAEVMSAMQWS